MIFHKNSYENNQNSHICLFSGIYSLYKTMKNKVQKAIYYMKTGGVVKYNKNDKYIVEKLFFSQYKFGAKQGGIL